jgi:hypothetical protein
MKNKAAYIIQITWKTSDRVQGFQETDPHPAGAPCVNTTDKRHGVFPGANLDTIYLNLYHATAKAYAL